jgi:hypothetical protein
MPLILLTLLSFRIFSITGMVYAVMTVRNGDGNNQGWNPY